jgi:hypothetical protein
MHLRQKGANYPDIAEVTLIHLGDAPSFTPTVFMTTAMRKSVVKLKPSCASTPTLARHLSNALIEHTIAKDDQLHQIAKTIASDDRWCLSSTGVESFGCTSVG